AVGLGRRDARRVLPAMLQQQERVVDLLVDRALPDHSDDAAHGSYFAPASGYAPTSRTAPPSTPLAPSAKSPSGRTPSLTVPTRQVAIPACERVDATASAAASVTTARNPTPRFQVPSVAVSSRRPASARTRNTGGGDQVDRSTSTQVPV